MKRMAIAGLVVAAGLSGCAAWNTSTKNINLEKKSIALDAKQRVIISKENRVAETTYVTELRMAEKLDEDGKVLTPAVYETVAKDHKVKVARHTCAEPSPDALSVLGASADLGISKPGSVTGSGSLSLAEAAASIGLRTQSIQLLRDAGFRACEGASNDDLSPLQYEVLLRRNQSTMLGVLAIEQLTGPVVAAQAALTAAAKGGAGEADAQAVSAAKTEVETKETALLDQEKELGKVQVAAGEKREALAKAKDARAAAAADADVTQLDKDVATADTNLKLAEVDVENAQARVDLARDRVRDARAALAQVQIGKASTGVMTTAELTHQRIQSAMAAEQLSKAVGYVVAETNASYVRDGCFGLVTDLIGNPDKISALNRVDRAGAGADNIEPLQILKTALVVCANQFNRDIADSYRTGTPRGLFTPDEIQESTKPGGKLPDRKPAQGSVPLS